MFMHRQRPAYQESLREIAIAAPQELELRDGFHTFRGNFDVETACHGNRGANDALVTAVRLDVLDQ
jgi:hypothetical protein